MISTPLVVDMAFEFKMQIFVLVLNRAWIGVNDQLNAWHTKHR